MQGILKGYDQLLNLVLDEALEYLRGVWSFWTLTGTGEVAGAARPYLARGLPCFADPEDPLSVTDETRTLGLLVSNATGRQSSRRGKRRHAACLQMDTSGP